MTTVSSLDLLDRLVAFPTVSRDSNLGLIGFVGDFLAQHGIAARLIGDATGAKANLFATVGGEQPGGVMLSGHTDVVPVDGQAWSSDPFRLTRRDDRFYGRGAADMKGFLACALRAAANAATRRLRRPLHLAFSYDEEIGCIGVRSLIEELRGTACRPRFCIVGEPTSMWVATGHKGKINARATCCGVAGHSALAPLALNAIHLATDFIGALRRRQAALASGGAADRQHDVPYTTVHAGRIAGGVALNIVPSECVVDFEIRNIAADDAAAILERIFEDAQAIAGEARERFAQAAIRIERINDYPGLDTAPADAIVTWAQALLGDAPTLKVAFGTEAGLFHERLGLDCIVCGPGSMDQGHKPDEFIERDQLARCDAMLDRVVEELAG